MAHDGGRPQGSLARAWSKVAPAQIWTDPRFLKDFTLGGVSPAVSAATTYPFFERYGWICMTSPENKDEGPMGIVRFWASTAQTDMFSLWRGCLPKMLMYFPRQAFNITLLDAVRSFLPGTWKRGTWTPPHGLPKVQVFASSAFVHHTCSFWRELVAYPLRVMEQIAAVQVPVAPAAFGLWAFLSAPISLVSRFADLIQARGMLGLWSGFGPYFLGRVLERTVSQLLLQVLPPSLACQPSFFIITLTSKIAAHPLMLVSSRLAVSGGASGAAFASLLGAFPELSKPLFLEFWRGARLVICADLVFGLLPLVFMRLKQSK